MRLHTLCGRESEALRQYERLEEALGRELGVEPGAESRRLREEIASGTFPPQPSQTGPVPGDCLSQHADTFTHNLPLARGDSFVGREREVAEVKRALSMTNLLTPGRWHQHQTSHAGDSDRPDERRGYLR